MVGDLMSTLTRIAKDVRSDPETRKKAEEYQLKYGAIGEDDLRKIYSI
ncbi:MAG: hypothetical protein IPI63_06155 [Methanothrix sp.]|nr:hypothetical protein [Methanothrix sp.]MBK7386319.1 hypothetical protein [Methanothrix sp.]HPW73545.1 hypothetical protein [Methanothrix sp.]